MFGSVTLRGGTTEWLGSPDVLASKILRSMVCPPCEALLRALLACWQAGMLASKLASPSGTAALVTTPVRAPCAASTGSDIKVADHSYATLYVQWLWLVCWMFKLRHSLTASRISPPLALLSTKYDMAYADAAERFALCFASVTLRGWKDGKVALVIQNCGASSSGNARNTNCKNEHAEHADQ